MTGEEGGPGYVMTSRCYPLLTLYNYEYRGGGERRHQLISLAGVLPLFSLLLACVLFFGCSVSECVSVLTLLLSNVCFIIIIVND